MRARRARRADEAGERRRRRVGPRRGARGGWALARLAGARPPHGTGGQLRAPSG